MSGRCVIRVEHVWTCFGEHLVHQDINLCLEPGDILGLVGVSGSGKTTLMREMIGLLTPSRGEISVFDVPLSGISVENRQRLRSRFGVLFQGGALFSALNVFDNIAFPLRELRFPGALLIEQLVCMKLAMVRLEAKDAMRMPAELSGGMVKRAALARALILEPDLLFLDEPTSGLDPLSGQEFVDLVAALHRELGFTVVMITHDLSILTDLCTRVAVLADHRLVASGTLDSVLACSHPFVHDFFHGRRGRPPFESGEAG